MNATTINIGKSNTSVNVVSGILNASNFILYSGNKVNALNTTCWLDTIAASSGVRQLAIGMVNAHEVYIGAGSQNTKVDIGNIANTANTITIGNTSSIVAINASSLNIGSELSNQINLGVTDINTTYKGQIHIGAYYYFNSESGVYINDGCSDNNQLTAICTNSSSRIQIGSANGTRTSPITLYGNIRINPDGVKNSTTIGCATVPTIINTKLTVDGSAVNAGTNIMTIKQNTGDYMTQTDGAKDPFSIMSPNSGTLSVNNSIYNNLTLGMGLDTNLNFGYINCAMLGAVRPIVIGGRYGGDTYIGYRPPSTYEAITEFQQGGNLWVKGNITTGLNIICGCLEVNNNFNVNTMPYKLYLGGKDRNHSIHSTGSNGNTMIFVEFGLAGVGTWYFYSSAQNKNVASVDGNGAWSPLSDVNSKKDFEPSTIGLNEILQLKPTLYRFKTESDDAKKSLGFIAQDVKHVIPEAYTQHTDFIGLNYNVFIPVIVKAMQEMKADYDKKIADLESRLLALESKNP